MNMQFGRGIVVLSTVLCAAALTFFLPSIASAQPRAQEGDLVRVRTQGGGTEIGVFRGLEGAVLHLAHLDADSEELRSLRLTEVSRVERRVTRTAGAGAVRGAAIGFGLGTLSGAGLGYLARDDNDCDRSVTFCEPPGTPVIGGAIILGVLGTAVGAIAGAAWPGEEWQRAVIRRGDEIETRERARIIIAPDRRGIRVGAEVRR
jgi:hypothetical protein